MQELTPRLPCKHGRLKATLELWWAYPYSAPAHSWQPPSSRAVCSAIKVPELQGVESCLLHLLIRSTGGCPPETGGCSTAILPSPLLLGATEVSTQQQCAEVSEPRVSAPSAHPDVCAESRSLGQDAHSRHSLSRDSVPADRCIGTGRHPSAASHRREYLPSACLPSRHFFCLAGQDRHPPGVADA